MLLARHLILCMAVAWGLGPAPAQAETIQVTIDKLQFAPAEIHAKAGDPIVWVNKDFVAHTATVRGGWDVTIAANGSARLPLTKAGTFEYYCRFHPNMTGRVTIMPR